MDSTDTRAGSSDGGTTESGIRQPTEKPHQITRVKIKFIRAGIVVTLALSAWAGIWMSGMSKPWAVLFSILGGFLAMVGGMVMAGIKYEDDTAYLSNEHTKHLKSLSDKLEEMEKGRVQDRRDFGMVALEATKTVADKVANRLLARHASHLHVEEQRDAALKEADAIVSEEIMSYGQGLKSK